MQTSRTVNNMEVKELFSRLKKEAECSICIHTVNKPKCLPCLHSFCLECINNFAATKRKEGKTTFGCPECSATMKIPDGDKFDDFPTSFYLNRLLDILALEDGSTEEQKCNSCDEDAPATSFCFQCKNFLCSACLAAHNRLKLTRAHRQASLRNLAAGDVEELIQRPVLCEKAHHKDEPLEYYCQDCQDCICLRCSATAHNQHIKLDIGDAAEQHKAEIIQSIHKIKYQVSESKQEMERDKENFEAFEEQVKSSRDKVQATLSELFRVLKDYETSIMKKLDDLFTKQREVHSAQQKNFELSLAQMNSSTSYMEAIVERNIGVEIIRSRTAVTQRYAEILKENNMKASKISKVDFVTNDKLCQILRQSAPGRVVTSFTDPSSSTAEGPGLQEAECGKRAEFTIITKEAEGKMYYSENDQVTVDIQTAGGEVEAEVKNNKDGTYHVTYTPMKHGESHVIVKVNDHVLPGSPWDVHVTPHQYQAVSSFGSKGTGKEEFESPWGVTVDSIGNVAVADNGHNRVQVFNSEGRYLNEFGQGGEACEKLNCPYSVAYINPEHIAVVDYSSKVLLFKVSGEFIKHFSPVHIQSPSRISVTKDGHVIVCERESKKVLVLSPDGSTLLQSFKAPNCDTAPLYAVHHEDNFFVSYPGNHCIKVFDAAGNYTRDIGCERTGHGQFQRPRGLAIDTFNNLVVVDDGNNRLHIFTPEGEFVSAIGEEGTELGQFSTPEDVAVSRDGRLYVTDYGNNRVQIVQ